MNNEKQRAAKEAIYEVTNKDAKSVCSGQFYKKSSKSYEKCKNCANCFKYKSFKSKSEYTPEVKFHYVDTFRKCELYKIKYITEEDIIMTCIYNIIYVNDLACSCVIDLQDYINDQDKETQKVYRALKKRQKEYEAFLNETLTDKLSLLAEYNSAMDDHVLPVIEWFKDAMRKQISNASDDNVDFISLVEVARTIIGYSTISVEKRIEQCLKYNKDSVNLRGYKLVEMLSIVENLSKWTTRKCKKIDLNDSKEIIDSYRELDKTLTNFEIINDCINKAKKVK